MSPYSALVLAAAGLLAACGSSGSAHDTPGPASAVQVTMDTAGGHPATVSVQVVGAVLERPDGSRTDNMLPAPVQLTLSDPAAAPSGMMLENAPGGTYASLVLVVVPGSCAAQYPDGRIVPTELPAADVRCEFEQPVELGAHNAAVRGAWAPAIWLALRHAAPVTLTGSGTGNGGSGNGARHGYTPHLVCSLAEEQLLAGTCVVVTAVAGETIFGALEGEPEQRLQLEIDPAAELFDDHGNQVGRARFLADCSTDAEICVTGTVDPFGIVRVRRARCATRTDNPRLIGRIVELLPAETAFTFDVQAIARRHGHRELVSPPERVTVRAGSASIHWSHTCRELAFADLGTGDLGKVTWSERTGDVVTAREIEITGRNGLPAHPEFEGRVLEVHAAENLVVMVPRDGEPILVSGVPVTRLLVQVLPTTEIVRRALHGPARTAIPIEDIVAGDRIWVRGTVTAPASTPPVGTLPAGTILASVDADWIRVRAEH